MASAPDPLEQRRAQMFSTLAPEQVARIAPLGARRQLRRGEVLYDQGDREIPFYVVMRGTLEAVRPHDATEDAITILGPGQFTGEIEHADRAAQPRARARVARTARCSSSTATRCARWCRPTPS